MRETSYFPAKKFSVICAYCIKYQPINNTTQTSLTNLTPASHTVLPMMTSPEQDPTVQGSATVVAAPAETASSDTSKNVAKEDSSSSKSAEDESAKAITTKKDTKRYLPAHKKTNAALTFPEKVRYNSLAGAFCNVIPPSILSHSVFSFSLSLFEDDELDEIRRREK